MGVVPTGTRLGMIIPAQQARGLVVAVEERTDAAHLAEFGAGTGKGAAVFFNVTSSRADATPRGCLQTRC
jgi:hypothetical protein